MLNKRIISNIKTNDKHIVILLFLLIIYTYWAYLPGINGHFIFDDVNNISPIGKYSQLSLWDNFQLFLLEGRSGPTGRPLSLASFYLNDTNWPSSAPSFIYTNILIHLLNGVLIFWLSIKLFENITRNKIKQKYLALLAASLWILHPLHTTTVLYIVQRMTELSATFTLAGLIFYLYGREKLVSNKTIGLSLLFFGTGTSLVLAILSKENGILLATYILTIEFFLLQPLEKSTPKYLYYWIVPVAFLPFLFIVSYLLLTIFSSETVFSNRNFTLIERLLTESRIVFEYLFNIITPDMSNSSLYHDDFIHSKGLLSPWTTILSIMGILGALIFSFIKKKKYPLISFSIIWFLSGHLLESTVLPLELYFEHRNYLPMFGIIFIIAWAMLSFSRKQAIIIALPIITIFLFSFLLIQNSILWGKPFELLTNWHNAHPNSQRTTEMYLATFHKHGLKAPEKTRNNMNSLFIAQTILAELSRNCSDVTAKDLRLAKDKLKNIVIHSSGANGLADFINSWKQGKCEHITSNDMEGFLTDLSILASTRKSRAFASHVFFRLAMFYRDQRDLEKTMINLNKAYEYYPDSEMLKQRAGYLMAAGLYKEALKVLDDTILLEKSFRARLALKIKQKELDEIKKIIIEKINLNNNTVSLNQ